MAADQSENDKLFQYACLMRSSTVNINIQTAVVKQGQIQKFLVGDEPEDHSTKEDPSLMRVPEGGLGIALCKFLHFFAISAYRSDVFPKCV